LPEALLGGLTKRALTDAGKTEMRRNPDGTSKRGAHSRGDFTDVEWAQKQQKAVEGQRLAWGCIFHMDKKPFKYNLNAEQPRRYRFDGCIQTDGFAVSVHVEHPEVQLSKQKGEYRSYPETDYLQDLPQDELVELQGRGIVAIDPGVARFSALNALNVVLM
jgi:hypothetical protein